MVSVELLEDMLDLLIEVLGVASSCVRVVDFVGIIVDGLFPK